MTMESDQKLLGKIGCCIESAAKTYRHRTTVANYNALGDIENDLEVALEAVKELFRRRNQH